MRKSEKNSTISPNSGGRRLKLPVMTEEKDFSGLLIERRNTMMTARKIKYAYYVVAGTLTTIMLYGFFSHSIHFSAMF